GPLAPYDPPNTVNGNIKLTTSGTFSISNDINALVIDSTDAGGAITVAINNDNGVAGGALTSRRIVSGTVVNVGAGNSIVGGNLLNPTTNVTPAGRLNVAT